MISSNSQSAIRRFVLMCSVLAVTVLAERSYAQIEEVVVTATKREQSLQDVGVAVTAFSGEELRDRNIVRPQELFNEVPNVSVQTNSVAGQMLVSMRGLSFATFSPIGVQPVIVFQDEIPHSSPATAGLFIFDLERVEVLRGPQNILYGRNTTGGAVNFIARKPEIGGGTLGFADLSIGNYDTIDLNAALGGELGDSAAYRLSVQSLNNDGYWDNLIHSGDRLGERNQHLLRFQVAYEPNDDISWLFNIHGGTSSGAPRPVKGHGFLSSVNPGADCENFDHDNFESSCIDALDGRTVADTDKAFGWIRGDIDDTDALGGSVRLDWSFENVEFMSLTGYESNEWDKWEDNSGMEFASFVLFRQSSENRPVLAGVPLDIFRRRAKALDCRSLCAKGRGEPDEFRAVHRLSIRRFRRLR